MSAEARALAIVTGGGSGIGAATAIRLARRGLDVLVTGRTPAKLDNVVETIRAAGGRAEAVAADCGTEDGRTAIVAAAAGRPVRAFVHSAGRDPVTAFAETTPAVVQEVLAVNVVAPFFLAQALLPLLADGASITFVGSVAARRGMVGHAIYGSSKAALTGLTINLASELAPRIRVNCVSPGGTNTAMLADYVEKTRTGLSEKEAKRQHVAASARILLRRVADPDEVAATIEHVALDATAMTGIDLAVDVGYVAS
ncbi:MAG: SDR family oxidoreductase [Pseudomonadota bacterium]|nr:SDR family oxidoreductase [Pseudomonadota bacterium]